MTHTTQENTTQDFHCSLAQQTVMIDRTFEIRVSRAGKRMGRSVADFNCSGKNTCGIASQGEGGTVYDWSRCVFQHPPA